MVSVTIKQLTGVLTGVNDDINTREKFTDNAQAGYILGMRSCLKSVVCRLELVTGVALVIIPDGVIQAVDQVHEIGAIDG
jgi:hypothetical protein